MSLVQNLVTVTERMNERVIITAAYKNEGKPGKRWGWGWGLLAWSQSNKAINQAQGHQPTSFSLGPLAKFRLSTVPFWLLPLNRSLPQPFPNKGGALLTLALGQRPNRPEQAVKHCRHCSSPPSSKKQKQKEKKYGWGGGCR